MDNKAVLRAAAVPIALAVLVGLVAIILPGDFYDNASVITKVVVYLLIAAGVIYLVFFLPGLYKKKTSKGGDKALRKMIMLDPRFRDALNAKRKVENWQDLETPPSPAPPKGPPAGKSGGPEKKP